MTTNPAQATHPTGDNRLNRGIFEVEVVERAAQLAAERYRPTAIDALDATQGEIRRAGQRGFTSGYLARDAEPTTITAEQVEKAAARLWEDFRFFRSPTWDDLPENQREQLKRHINDAFRVAGVVAEGGRNE